MLSFCDGLNDSKRRLLYVGGIALLLLVAITAAFLLARRARAKATLPVVGQLEQTTPASIRVDDFTAGSYTLEVVYKLAVKYHVVIGVYGNILDADNRKIDISIKNGMLRDVLDAITKADPRFEWHESSNGAVHFVPRGAPLTLMDVRVHSFEIYSPQSSEILRRLNEVPEIRDWWMERKCPTDYSIMGTGGEPVPWGRFSVHASDVPVWSILDEIAAKSRSYYWSFIQYGTQPCSMVMEWRNTQP